MKKTKRAIASSKLELNKQTLRVLTDDVLERVAGGALPPTHHTGCGTQCLRTEACDG
jgi:hypothetical protein